MTRALGDRNEEVAEIHLQHDRLADVRRDECRDRPARSKAMSGVVWWNRQQDRVQQFALKLLQAAAWELRSDGASRMACPPIDSGNGEAARQDVDLRGTGNRRTSRAGWAPCRGNRPARLALRSPAPATKPADPGPESFPAVPDRESEPQLLLAVRAVESPRLPTGTRLAGQLEAAEDRGRPPARVGPPGEASDSDGPARDHRDRASCQCPRDPARKASARPSTKRKQKPRVRTKAVVGAPTCLVRRDESCATAHLPSYAEMIR